MAAQLVQRSTVEMLDDRLDLIVEACGLLPGVAGLVPSTPQTLDDDLRLRPGVVDLFDQADVCWNILSCSHVVSGVVVVGADVVDDEVGGSLRFEVPSRWVCEGGVSGKDGGAEVGLSARSP